MSDEEVETYLCAHSEDGGGVIMASDFLVNSVFS